MGNVTRREVMKLAAAAAASAALPARWTSAVATPLRRRPNILMVVADDQRPDVVAALGNQHINTPNYDRLAQRGFALNHARVMIGNRAAVCVPSRATLLTGRTVFHTPFSMGDFVTLPQAFGKSGYHTYMIGKWHNGIASMNRSFQDGDSIYLGQPGAFVDQFNMQENHFDPTGAYDHPYFPSNKFSSEVYGDTAVNFIEHQTGDRPFFCYVAFNSPHDPRTPPRPFDTMYGPDSVPLPANFLPEHPFDNGELKIRDEMLAPFPRTPENTRRQLGEYYGMVSANDFHVGRMIAALEKSGLIENTIVVCTGDHGLNIGSHGLFGKQNVYEPTVQIPMIMAGPGIPHGRSDAFVYNLDLYPMLCEMSGVPIPASVEGKSFSVVIADNSKSFRDVSFHAYGMKGKMQRGVCDGRWKFHKYEVNGTITRLLFDLQNDPDEMHDLVADPAAAAQLDRMEKLLAKCQQEADDPVLHGSTESPE
jgi:arylsulfatase A-like enzyme